MKTDKIVIVGGGSAGWMTAATLVRAFPEKDISVIESPNVPSIGVGESTLGQIRRWTRYIGIDEKDFIPYTDATYKLSIQFTDFYKEDSGSFHYPFGRPHKDNPEENAVQNWHILREVKKDLPLTSLVDLNYAGSHLWRNNKFYENNDGRLGNFSKDDFVAYHFDAVKFGNWLRERYCLPRGIKHIQKHVNRVDLNDDGSVKELVMDDNERITADLFFDCTGFRSLILGAAMKEPFISYNDILPNDSAWACQIPYKDKYVELQSFTNCTAIENGWCWNIPLWSRIGTGYNYSSRYVDDETALEEFKNYLCSDKMLIPRTREEVESFTFRNLKTRVGTHERTFVKNVVAIGLSAGFIEPLESNGLLSVHEFLFFLVDIMQRGEISQFDRSMYNAQIRDVFDSFAKFVAMHYSMSHRNSTPYWQDTMEREYPEIIGGVAYDPYMQRSNAFQQAGRKFFDVWTNDTDEQNGMIYIAAGMNYHQMGGPRIAELEYIRDPERVREVSEKVYTSLMEQYNRWDKIAAESPHMVDYMWKHFYRE